MPPKPAYAATDDIRALFGTSALKYKAYADRQTTTEEHWRLKIVCSFKGSNKLRPKVSVCVFVWLLFFLHVLNFFTVANLQRVVQGRGESARKEGERRSEHCQRAVEEVSVCIFSMFSVYCFSVISALFVISLFFYRFKVGARDGPTRCSQQQRSPRRSALPGPTSQRTSLRCMVAALPSPSTKHRFVTVCVCVCVVTHTIIKHN